MYQDGRASSTQPPPAAAASVDCIGGVTGDPSALASGAPGYAAAAAAAMRQQQQQFYRPTQFVSSQGWGQMPLAPGSFMTMEMPNNMMMGFNPMMLHQQQLLQQQQYVQQQMLQQQMSAAAVAANKQISNRGVSAVEPTAAPLSSAQAAAYPSASTGAAAYPYGLVIPSAAGYILQPQDQRVNSASSATFSGSGNPMQSLLQQSSMQQSGMEHHEYLPNAGCVSQTSFDGDGSSLSCRYLNQSSQLPLHAVSHGNMSNSTDHHSNNLSGFDYSTTRQEIFESPSLGYVPPVDNKSESIVPLQHPISSYLAPPPQQTKSPQSRVFSTKGLKPGEEERWLSGLSVKQFIQEVNSLVKPMPQQFTVSVPAAFAHLLSACNIPRDGNLVVCDVCLEPQRPAALCLLGDLIVQCRDCKIQVHRRCYGVHRVVEIRADHHHRSGSQPIIFLCDVCRYLSDPPLKDTSQSMACFICGKEGGPCKRTASGKQPWVHVYCALTAPDVVSVRDLKNMTGFYENVSSRTRREQKAVAAASRQQDTDSPATAIKENNEDGTSSFEDPINVTTPDSNSLSDQSSLIFQTSSTPSDGLLLTPASQPSMSEEICLVCHSATGHFLKCSAPDCTAVMHAFCMRQFIRECELEGRNQISTCLDIRPGETISPTLGGSSGSTSVATTVCAYCPVHCPPPIYCSCSGTLDPQNEAAAMMVGCDVCGDWLHSGCIGPLEAECALQADNYQCSRCLQQRAQLALFDRMWATLPFDEITKATPQSRELLSSLLKATSTFQQIHSCLPNTSSSISFDGVPATTAKSSSSSSSINPFDIGNVIPPHMKPLPFPDLILIAASWCWSPGTGGTVTVKQASANTGENSSCTISEENKQQPSSTGPAIFTTSGLVKSAKKKFQLKKKNANDAGQSDCSSASGVSAPRPPSTVPIVKKPGVTMSTGKKLLGGPTGVVLKPLGGTDIAKKLLSGTGNLGTLKSSVQQRLIAKQTPSSILKDGQTRQAPKPVPISPMKKAAQKPCGPTLSAPTALPKVKSKVTSNVPKVKRSDVVLKKPAGTNEVGRVSDEVWPFVGIVNLCSLKQLLSSAPRVPFSVKFWEKELSACIIRCEMWLVEMTKAVQSNNLDSLQVCLKSHSQLYLSRLLLATKSELKSEQKPEQQPMKPEVSATTTTTAATTVKSEPKTSASLAVPKVTRVSVGLCCKSPLSSLLYQEGSSSAGFVGGIAVLTVEAATMRSQARVSLFLAANESLMNGTCQSISRVNKVVKDVETLPQLASLETHEVYISAKKILEKVKACSAASQQLRAAPKPAIADIQILVDDVASLPADCGVDLFSLPDLLARGRQLEAQIDWSSLRSMRDVFSQTQSLPLSSTKFTQLQELLGKVDTWRKEFRRFVSLMTAVGGQAAAGSVGDATTHRKNVVVSGQSGFLKDLFSGSSAGPGVSSTTETLDGGETQPTFTQNQTLEEAKELLQRGSKLAVSCEEIAQLRKWVKECDKWSSRVSQALMEVDEHEEISRDKNCEESMDSSSVAAINSWSLTQLIQLQRQKPLLPFAVPADLADQLDKRTDFLRCAEQHTIARILGQSISDNNATTSIKSRPVCVPSSSETVELARRAALLQAGATDSLNRAQLLRAVRVHLAARQQSHSEWTTAVEEALQAADRLLESFTAASQTSSSVSYTEFCPDALRADLKPPPRPYIAQEYARPVVDTLSLVQGNWWCYNAEEVQGLRSAVLQSISWLTVEQDLHPRVDGAAATEDELDENLFDDASCPTCPWTLAQIAKQFSAVRCRDQEAAELKELFMTHSVLLLTHFLMLCFPTSLLKHPLYSILQSFLAPLLLMLKLDGASIFAALTPADAPLLGRLVRGNNPPVRQNDKFRAAAKVADVMSQSWAIAEFSWQYIFIEVEEELITRCILKLLIMFFLVADASTGMLVVESLLSTLNSNALTVAGHGPLLTDVGDDQTSKSLLDLTSMEMASSSHKLSVVAILRLLRDLTVNHHISSSRNDKAPFSATSMESRLQNLLDKATWLFRVDRTLDILDRDDGGSVSLTEVATLLSESEAVLSNEKNIADEKGEAESFNDDIAAPEKTISKEMDAQERLQGHYDAAMNWFHHVRLELNQDAEARFFTPQLFHQWNDDLLQLVGALRPRYILVAVCQSQRKRNSISFLTGRNLIEDISISPVLVDTASWDKDAWRSVLHSFRQEWQLLGRSNDSESQNVAGGWAAVDSGGFRDVRVLPAESLGPALAELQQIVILQGVGDLAIGTRWIDMGMPASVLRQLHAEPDHEKAEIVSASLSPDQCAASVFLEAVNSTANGAEIAAPDEQADTIESLLGVPISSLRQSLQNVHKTSCRTSLLCPSYFASDLIARVENALSVEVLSAPTISVPARSALDLQWQRAVISCATQGWAAVRHSVLPGLEANFTEGELLVPNNIEANEDGDVLRSACMFHQRSQGERFLERCVRSATALLTTHLLEKAQMRRSRLMRLLQQRPARLCSSDEPLSGLLEIQLKLCDWSSAAVQTLQGQSVGSDSPSGNSSSSPKILSLTASHMAFDVCGKQPIEQIVLLIQHLESLKKEITAFCSAIVFSDSGMIPVIQRQSEVLLPILWSMGVSFEQSTEKTPPHLLKVDVGMIGGFLSFELSHRLYSIQREIETLSLSVASFSTPVLLSRTHYFKHVLTLFPIGRKITDPQLTALSTAAVAARDALTVVLARRAAAEKLVLRLWELLLAQFAGWMTRGGDGSRLVALLPPLFADGALSPVIDELGLLHGAEDFGVLVAAVHFLGEEMHKANTQQLSTLAGAAASSNVLTDQNGFSEENRLADNGATSILELPSFPTDFDKPDDLTTGVHVQMPGRPLCFFLHPQLLMMLAVVLDLGEFVDHKLEDFGHPADNLVSALATYINIRSGSLPSLDMEAEKQRICSMSFKSVLEEVMAMLDLPPSPVPEAGVTSNGGQHHSAADMPGVLAEPFRLLQWRLSVRTFLLPNVVPYDYLETVLVKLQNITSVWTARTSCFSLQFPDEMHLSQLIAGQPQLLQPFEARLRVFPPGHSVVRVCAAFLATYVLQSTGPEAVLQSSCCLGSQEVVFRTEEYRELTRRYENTTAVMLNFVQYQRDVSSGKAMPSGRPGEAEPTTYISIKTLAMTARRILHEQVVAHAAVESLFAYLEEIAVWEMSTRHVLEKLQQRQEKQHALLRHVQMLKEQAPLLNGVIQMSSELVQAIWDAHGMSDALLCNPTLPSNCHLGFATSISSYGGLQSLYARGTALSCAIRGQQLEALQGQLAEVICALGLLNTQSVALLKLARDTVAPPPLPEAPSATRSSMTSLTASSPVALTLLDKAPLDLVLQQSLFAELPSHPQVKDLLRRCVELEYLSSLLFWSAERDLHIAIEFPAPKAFLSFIDGDESTNDEVSTKSSSSDTIAVAATTSDSFSGDCAMVSEPITAPSSGPIDHTVTSLPSGTIPHARLLQLVSERCSVSWCPVVQDFKPIVERECWVRTVRQLFRTGDPSVPPQPQGSPVNPALKTIQALLAQGKQFCETPVAAPQEIVILRALLAASKLFLTEARSTPEQWIRFRFLQGCYPVFLGEEMRSLRTKLQQKHSNIFIDIVTQGDEVQEIQLLKDGQIKNRFIPLVKFPNYEDVSASRPSTAPPISSILSHAVQQEETAAARQIETQTNETTSLVDSVRASVRSCLEVCFQDGSTAAKERENTFFDVVGRAVTEEYFKGLQKVIVKRLQQSISVRKPAPNSTSKTPGKASSLETLLSAPANDVNNKQASTTSPVPSPPIITTVLSASSDPPYQSTRGGSNLPQTAPPYQPSRGGNNLLQSAGIIWNGILSGQRSSPSDMFCNGPIHLRLWLASLFTPVPLELHSMLSGVSEMSLTCEMSVVDFGLYIQSTTAQLLNVVLGASWTDPSPECQRIVQVLRPAKLQIITDKPKSQLTSTEAEVLQKNALEAAVRVLLFSPRTENGSSANVRLWIIPPTSTVTEARLPASIPKSNQLIFGVLEMNLVTPLSQEPRNLALGEIRAVATAVCHALHTLHESPTAVVSPESIPPFSNLRIAIPTTMFDYVLSSSSTVTQEFASSTGITGTEHTQLPQPLPSCHEEIRHHPVPASIGGDCISGNLIPARIPKRPRYNNPEEVTIPKAVVGGGAKLPPWQQQHHQITAPTSSPPKPAPATTLVALLQQQQQQARRAAAQDPYDKSDSVPSTERYTSASIQGNQPSGGGAAPLDNSASPSSIPPPWHNRLAAPSPPTQFLQQSPPPVHTSPQGGSEFPFVVPEALKSLFKGAAAELKNKRQHA